jgi:Ras-related GTP-binding protein A/B
MSKKKVLLMGKSGAGKTSMRSIIFANYMARDTMRLSPTLDVEHTHVRFLGNLVLNLWDCGGQYRFYESYFDSQRDTIFRNVEVLIYVFDIDSGDIENDITYFDGILDAMEQSSPDASIFVLIHKMDLYHEEDRERAFNERAALIQSRSQQFKMKCFATSIWDETLYRAWSAIVYSLIPNVTILENQLNDFCNICGADEIVLFEKATFLVISHISKLESTRYDSHRFERISNIIKQFKLSCSKSMAQFQGMEVRNSQYSAFIDAFTGNTYIMVIMTGDGAQVPTMLTQLNIAAARKHFERFIPST